MRPPQATSGIRISRVVILACALTAATIWALFFVTQWFRPFTYWLLDWHVYAAGARDLLDRDLYYTAISSPYRLPVDQFNYPPLSAVVVLPLLPLPDVVGGTIFIVANLVAVAATSLLTARILGLRKPAMWGAAGFLAYTIHPWMHLAFLANNTPLVLLLVTGFAYAHLQHRSRLAGISLGIAIGLKLWPAALLLLLIRERRWESLAWAGGLVGASLLLALIWLGFDVIEPFFLAMQDRGVIESWNPVLYVSWLRETFAWWPQWGGYAIGVVLALVPAHGRLGIGLGILAGLALVPNLWRTYLPTLVVAALFTIADLRPVLNRWASLWRGTQARFLGSPSTVERAVDDG